MVKHEFKIFQTFAEDLADNDEQDEPDITDFDEDYHYKDYPDEETRRGYNNDDQEVHKGFYNEEEFKDVFFYDESFQHDETTKVSQENEFQDGNREDVSSDGNDEFLIDDMILTKDQMDDLFLASDRRNGISEKDHLWPNGTVPVSISDSFSESTWRRLLAFRLKMKLQSLRQSTESENFVSTKPNLE